MQRVLKEFSTFEELSLEDLKMLVQAQKNYSAYTTSPAYAEALLAARNARILNYFYFDHHPMSKLDRIALKELLINNPALKEALKDRLNLLENENKGWKETQQEKKKAEPSYIYIG